MTFTGNPKTFSDRVATSYGTEDELLEAWSDGLRVEPSVHCPM